MTSCVVLEHVIFMHNFLEGYPCKTKRIHNQQYKHSKLFTKLVFQRDIINVSLSVVFPNVKVLFCGH